MSFESLGLSAELLRAVADQGYTTPTPVQAQAIPLILQGVDVMAGAQTGTGKTASFTLPLLHRLSPFANSSTSPARHPVRALILVPTRELAVQVEESVRSYGKYLPLRSVVIYGGINISPQIKELRSGVEILVATPGRLLDHVQQRTVNLSQVQILVLDEADRMLDMGFIPDIRRIMELLPGERQTMLFSATFSEDIKRLADQILRSPVLVEVARRNAASELVEQVVHPVAQGRKCDLLEHLVKTQGLHQVLVFTRTKQAANHLGQQLVRKGIAAAAIHGDKTQAARMQALEEFKQGTVQVLVGTDVAARGLDIDQLPCVVNYELPHVAEDYIHRIGRTGRAGSTGRAISLVCEEERRYLADIERLIKRKIDQETVPGFEPGAANATEPAGSGRSQRGWGRDERTLAGGAPARRPIERQTAPAAAWQPDLGTRGATERPAEASQAVRGREKGKEIAALFLPPKQAGDRG